MEMVRKNRGLGQNREESQPVNVEWKSGSQQETERSIQGKEES